MKLKHLMVLGLSLVVGLATLSARHRSFGDGLPEYLQQFDVNEDGKIDEEERQAVKAAREARHEEWIAQWDTDDDGELSEDERDAAREAIRENIETKRAERFAELAGEDGSLSLEEFSSIEAFADVDPERIAALFDRMDADDSGDVNLEEFTARLRHHRKPRRHGDRDGPDGPGGR